MPQHYKTIISTKKMPDKFCDETVKRIARIESVHSVVGIMFLRKGLAEMYTVPETTAHSLTKKLPKLNIAMHQALTEINSTYEDNLIMKIIHNLLKDCQDELLVSTTSLLNKVNPMVDRIMDDESVEGVVMTNKEGVPILTNVSVTSATNYALSLHHYGTMAQNYIKEIDPFDEVLAIRLKTRNREMMLARDPEFNIIVVQHFRHITKKIEEKK